MVGDAVGMVAAQVVVQRLADQVIAVRPGASVGVRAAMEE